MEGWPTNRTELPDPSIRQYTTPIYTVYVAAGFVSTFIMARPIAGFHRPVQLKV
jgi:hypothetical protein